MSANQIIYAHQYLDHSGTVTTASVDNVSLTHYDGSARHNPGLAVTHVDKKRLAAFSRQSAWGRIHRVFCCWRRGKAAGAASRSVWIVQPARRYGPSVA